MEEEREVDAIGEKLVGAGQRCGEVGVEQPKLKLRGGGCAAPPRLGGIHGSSPTSFYLEKLADFITFLLAILFYIIAKSGF